MNANLERAGFQLPVIQVPAMESFNLSPVLKLKRLTELKKPSSNMRCSSQAHASHEEAATCTANSALYEPDLMHASALARGSLLYTP